MMKQMKIGVYTLLMLTLLTGVLYPAVITVVAQLMFPHQANGNVIEVHGKKLGSSLIGQAFSSPKYFWGRPSATLPRPYNALASTGSNLGPLNKELIASAKMNVERFNASSIPVDLVTASGSGLDPEISPHAAYYQIPRIAKMRGMSNEQIKLLVDQSIEGRFLGVFGEPRVNVLLLNLKLDNLVS